MAEREIPFDKIEAGMELACDIENKYKKILIRENTRLEEKHKFLLKTWGIKSIKVKIDDDEEQQISITDEQKAEALSKLKKRMFWNPRNEIENELVNVAIQRLCQNKNNSK